MDGQRFDELTRVLAAGVSRRRMVGMAAGGIAAVAGVFRRGVEAAPNRCAVGCANFKGPQKAACQQACRDCDGDFNRVCFEEGPFGIVGFTCCPEESFCLFGLGVCCEFGTEPCFGPEGVTCCPEGTFCDFETGTCGPPATCDAESGCFGGTCAIGCFCVSSIEGDRGACVSGAFANCDAPQCTSSAECGDGGVCVDGTDCCGFPTQICFPPEAICEPGGGGAGLSPAGTPGWH